MSCEESLIQQGEQLFSKRGSFLTLLQTIAENFYPERADFTSVRNLGSELASDLMTSYPIIARRDLGNAFGAMLRPTNKDWKKIRTKLNWEKIGPQGRAWCEWASVRHTRALYNRNSQFTRATKEGDHDFAAFGQTVIQTSLNKDRSGLLFRCWHLRDVAWMEDENGKIQTVYRKWKPTILMLSRLFPGKLHPEYQRRLEKEPYLEVDIWHCVIPTDTYQGDKKIRTKFVSVYLDVANKYAMEEIGVKILGYTIPRWQTVSGSQYAYSPATVAALPDARLIQAMTRVLLEAGEKATNPPMVATHEVVRSDINIYAGGVTWVDSDYDERLGEALRPLQQNIQGIPLGLDMARDIRMMIAEAFYLNKLTLPQPGTEMTAYETGQRIQEYIRQAMPLFEPMEPEYNAPVCEDSFQLMLDSGAFGSPFDMPKELRGEEIEFAFESPLHDATERAKGQRFLEAGSMLAQAAQIDPTTVYVVDIKKAFRDVLQAIDVPSSWQRTELEANAMADAAQQQQQTAQLLSQMQQGADVAQKLSSVTPPGAAA